MRMKMLATEMKKQERTMHPCPACDENGVVDFINVPFFATFNVADIAINVGVGLLLIGAIIRR